MSEIKLQLNILDNVFNIGRFESDNVTTNDLSLAIVQMELIKEEYLNKIKEIQKKQGKNLKGRIEK